jgi:hypothetical protein
VLGRKESVVPFEPDWRRHRRGRLDADGRDEGSEDPWWSRERDADDRGNEVDLFGDYTPAGEPVEPGPSSRAPLSPLSPPATLSPPAPSPPRRRRWSRLLATLALMVALAAGAAGGVLFERGRAEATAGFSPDVQVITRPVPQVPPACQAALDKAKQALGFSAQVERALAAHTNVINRLIKGQLRGADALRAGTPLLTRGAQASAQLDDAAAQYRNLSRQCGP